MNKHLLKCTSCGDNIYRWKYEMLKFKDIKSYKCKTCKSKNSKETRSCLFCKKEFTVYKREDKKTCSRSCSNSYFRVGPNNGNWKDDVYRSTCFLYHEKSCIICKEDNIVAVHHLDENHNNNSIDNLVPLCPTHHQYMHSKYKKLIINQVNNYINNFKRAVA